MARKKLHDPIHDEDYNPESHLSESAESFYDDEAEYEANDSVDKPVFIARMPNLEESRPIRRSVSSRSVWNSIFEFHSKITDRQQIVSLWCVVAVLVCLLFWSFLRDMSPNASEMAQKETPLVVDEKDSYRVEKREKKSDTVSERIAFSDHTSARSVYEMEEDDLSLVLPTTDIEVSSQAEYPEYPGASETYPEYPRASETAFEHVDTQPVFSANTQSAWDREESTLPAAVNPQPVVHEPGPDYSALANEQWNVPAANPSSNPVYATTPSTYNAPAYGPQPTLTNPAPQVSQVQYTPNPHVPSYGGQTIPNQPQGIPAAQPNGNLGNGAYVYPNNVQPNAPYGASAMPSNATAQYNYQANGQRQYPGTQYNTANYTEEIPATPTNNTYRNPGAPSYGASPYQNQQQIASNNTPPQYGQLTQQPQNVQSGQQYNYNPSYTQPTYGQQPITASGAVPAQRY